MKKIYSVFLVATFFIAGTASAQMGMMNYSAGNNNAVTASTTQNSTISTALQAIYATQNINSQSQIICSKVTDTQFEKLGDAVMGYGITEQQHTAMENMMGGEGSATLTQAHINMGRSYIGCWANYSSAPMPMMGLYGSSTPTNYYSMMGNRSYGNWGMMSGSYADGYNNWSNWITMILAWVFLGLGIAALIKWLRNK